MGGKIDFPLAYFAPNSRENIDKINFINENLGRYYPDKEFRRGYNYVDKSSYINVLYNEGDKVDSDTLKHIVDLLLTIWNSLNEHSTKEEKKNYYALIPLINTSSEKECDFILKKLEGRYPSIKFIAYNCIIYIADPEEDIILRSSIVNYTIGLYDCYREFLSKEKESDDSRFLICSSFTRGESELILKVLKMRYPHEKFELDCKSFDCCIYLVNLEGRSIDNKVLSMYLKAVNDIWNYNLLPERDT